MCTRFANSKLVREARIRPVGYQSVAQEASITQVLRNRALDPRVFATAMVVIADDRVAVGAGAFNMVLRRRGGWHAIAGETLSLPVLSLLERLVYRAIAANRRRISVCLGASICSRDAS